MPAVWQPQAKEAQAKKGERKLPLFVSELGGITVEIARPLQSRMRIVKREGFKAQWLHKDDATGTEWVVKRLLSGRWIWENTDGNERGITSVSRNSALQLLNFYLTTRTTTPSPEL